MSPFSFQTLKNRATIAAQRHKKETNRHGADILNILTFFLLDCMQVSLASEMPFINPPYIVWYGLPAINCSYAKSAILIGLNTELFTYPRPHSTHKDNAHDARPKTMAKSKAHLDHCISPISLIKNTLTAPIAEDVHRYVLATSIIMLTLWCITYQCDCHEASNILTRACLYSSWSNCMV
ncbi:hypothetical protein A45J_1862 [hot springs metagenome]|uniref:Uncharacterized protein n=1 Tax=hot springs metagenome TaxID=433727 RepID=A0A5J4KXX0_9ZZZZ